MARILLPGTLTSQGGQRPATHWIDVHLADQGTAAHARLQTFVAEAFRKRYGAEIRNFLPHFLHICNHRNEHQSVVGYRGGAEGPFFLEHYLDHPIEQVLSARLGRPVPRAQIVEVGNLADSTPGMARLSIIATTRCLHGMGYRWVVFTGVRRLYNAFHRLGLHPLELADADPRRLPPEQAQCWGDYYRDHPKVYMGRIEDGYRHMLSSRDRHPVGVLHDPQVAGS